MDSSTLAVAVVISSIVYVCIIINSFILESADLRLYGTLCLERRQSAIVVGCIKVRCCKVGMQQLSLVCCPPNFVRLCVEPVGHSLHAIFL